MEIRDGVLLLTPREFGRKVRSARTKLGLSQFGLAKEIRCAQSRISTVERGVGRPGDEIVQKLSKRLSIQVDGLVIWRRRTRDAA